MIFGCPRTGLSRFSSHIAALGVRPADVLIALAGLMLGLPAQPATAWNRTPFDSFNQSPLVQIYGLPALGHARVLNPDQTRLELAIVLASHFTSGATADEEITLDGETHRRTLIVQRGLGHGMEWGIELPQLSQRGGSLDSVVEDWHDLFNLPDGGRPQTARKQLNYRYQRYGQSRIGITQPDSGVGDLRLTGARQLSDGGERGGHDLALRASLKLPTGDADSLFGSGGTDFALWLSAACGQVVCSGDWGSYGGVGVLWVGRGEVLPELQRHVVAFGSAGISWRATGNVSLKAQLDAHTAFYRDTRLPQLGSASAQLVMGGTWALSRQTAMDFALAEDIIVNTAPDVSFLLAIRHHF
jgi:hypothetical protein